MEGNDIKNFRLSHGLSRAKLGKELGMSSATIERWESGKAKPNDIGRYKLNEAMKRRGTP